MPKGKKFDAAEKHFMEKKVKLEKELKEARARTIEAVEKADRLQIENDALRKENEQLKSAAEMFAKANNLSPEDLKALLESSKRQAEFVGMFKALTKQTFV